MILMYLNQMARYEQLAQDEMDLYGNAAYGLAVSIPCRREIVRKEVADSTGKIVSSTLTYFLDATQVPQESEKLDGRLIIAKEPYIDGMGTLVGWEVYT